MSLATDLLLRDPRANRELLERRAQELRAGDEFLYICDVLDCMNVDRSLWGGDAS